MGAPLRYTPPEDEIFLTAPTIAEVNDRRRDLGFPTVTADAWQGRKRYLSAAANPDNTIRRADRLARLIKETHKLRDQRDNISLRISDNETEISRITEELGL